MKFPVIYKYLLKSRTAARIVQRKISSIGSIDLMFIVISLFYKLVHIYVELRKKITVQWKKNITFTVIEFKGKIKFFDNPRSK